jgi:hypothetical protein
MHRRRSDGLGWSGQGSDLSGSMASDSESGVNEWVKIREANYTAMIIASWRNVARIFLGIFTNVQFSLAECLARHRGAEVPDNHWKISWGGRA